MYKRLTLEELRNINTSFFSNLRSLCEREHHAYFREFVNNAFDKGRRHYFFESNRPIFRMQMVDDNTYRFIDEEENIELVCNEDKLNRLHSILRDTQKMKQMSTKEGIRDMLFREFQEGDYTRILDKPYIVYDIETTFDGYNFRDQQFEMAYTIQTDDDHNNSMKFKYVDRDTMKKLCDYLLDYEGWIIGYNQIAFDNPVLVRNVGYSDKELRVLNDKSIDPFLILRKLVGKRMSLNAVSSILISEGKTLSSGREGEQLLQMYKETGEDKFLNKVKKYCKNDVKITLGVMLYLLKYQQIYLDGKAYSFDMEELRELGREKQKNGKGVTRKMQRLVQ